MEGLSSLLIVQKLGQVGKELVSEGEGYQFGLLVAAAAAYVTSAWWIVVVRLNLRTSFARLTMDRHIRSQRHPLSRLLYLGWH